MKNKDIYNFLISLARDLNKFYKLKLNKKFKAMNKGSDSNYDPVTIADKKFVLSVWEWINFGFKALTISNNFTKEKIKENRFESFCLWIFHGI